MPVNNMHINQTDADKHASKTFLETNVRFVASWPRKHMQEACMHSLNKLTSKSIPRFQHLSPGELAKYRINTHLIVYICPFACTALDNGLKCMDDTP